MVFHETEIPGVIEVETELNLDDRGSFERIYCRNEFSTLFGDLPDAQCAVSRNFQRATLRGLHYIPEEFGEVKLVRCIAGSVYDVAVDVRISSPTYGRYVSRILAADNAKALMIPKGVAHGFLTLEPDSAVLYGFSEFYRPGFETGVRWNDPDLAIEWPLEPAVISDRDRALPLLGGVGIGR